MNETKSELKNKVAVVTGGSRGIGKEIAKTLSQSGIKVVLTSRNKKKLDEVCNEIQGLGGNAYGFQADVSDPERTFEVIKEVQEKVGPIDILINNAGIGGENGPIWTNDQEIWWKTVEINLRGPMLYTQAVLEEMIKRKSGTIINIGSYAGIRPLPYVSSYSTSK
ncbi:MAG: SDR family NAD(P)-dependent oxidoreductase, partial [Candidatus Hodarchaeales archaeon]